MPPVELLCVPPHPFQPLLLRWEAVALFTLLVTAQHALLWDLWRGQFPIVAATGNMNFDRGALLPVVHAGTLLVGILLLAFASPPPELVRVEALRLGFKNLGAIFSRSAVSLALALAAIAGLGLLSQFIFSLVGSFQIYAITTFNLAETFLAFALLLECCRLRHKHRALGFIALGLFILCVIPFIFASVFSSESLARFSLLAPGFIALVNRNDPESALQLGAVTVHLGVVVLLFIAWQRQWRRLLEKAA